MIITLSIDLAEHLRQFIRKQQFTSGVGLAELAAAFIINYYRSASVL